MEKTLEIIKEELREHIAASIIDRCKHLSPDLTPCSHCVESAHLAFE